MIECPHCSKSHRSEEKVEQCRVRQEKRKERALKKAFDKERRIKNWNNEPPSELVRRLRGQEGMAWDRITTRLNRDYPPPEFEDSWTVLSVVWLYAEHLKWGTLDTETKAMMLLERHVLGDYVTLHPLEAIQLPEELLPIGAMQQAWAAEEGDEEWRRY